MILDIYNPSGKVPVADLPVIWAKLKLVGGRLDSKQYTNSTCTGNYFFSICMHEYWQFCYFWR